jgi:DinB family protein
MYNEAMTTQDLRYPIGEFDPSVIVPQMREAAIEDIAALPVRMRDAVRGLSESQLDTPYRPGGWTVRQVVHHVPDSHLNAYIRLKLALTEDNPTIKPYDEGEFAKQADMRLPVEVSLSLLDALHARWIAVWRSMTPGQFARPFFHPEIGPITADYLLQLYGWHSRHHVAHITRLREREGW